MTIKERLLDLIKHVMILEEEQKVADFDPHTFEGIVQDIIEQLDKMMVVHIWEAVIAEGGPSDTYEEKTISLNAPTAADAIAILKARKEITEHRGGYYEISDIRYKETIEGYRSK